MVELSRSFRREPLGRPPGSSTLVGVPALPRVPDDSGLIAQAGATFARGLYALSDAATAIAERDRQLKRAEEVAQSAKAVGEFQLGMAPVQGQMVEQNVPTLQRPEYLKTQGQGLIDQLAQNVPPRVQTAFRAQATQDLARMVLSEQSRASQLFVDEQKTALPAILGMVAQQRVGADERQLASIDQSLSAIATSFVDAGILSAPLSAALVREAIDRTDTQRAQNAIMAQPQTMLSHLQQRAAGKDGIAGMPDPPAQDLPALIQQAQGQVRQDLERVEREERRASRELVQVQEANMIRLQSQLYKVDLSAQDVQRLQQEATTLAQNRQLSQVDHGVIMRETRSLGQALAQGPQQSDPKLKNIVIRQLYGGRMGAEGLDALHEQILQDMEGGRVNMKDGQEWLTEIRNQRNANYYTHVPAYQEGKQFLDHTVNYLAEYNRRHPDVNQEALARLESKSAHALQEYSRRMRDIWRREGVAGVEAQAPEEARRVMTLFGVTPPEVLDYFPEPAPLKEQSSDLPREERYQKAYDQLRSTSMPDAEKAELYRQLRSREQLEAEVRRSEDAEERATRLAKERQDRTRKRNEQRIQQEQLENTLKDQRRQEEEKSRREQYPKPIGPTRPYGTAPREEMEQELERQQRQGYGPGQRVP